MERLWTLVAVLLLAVQARANPWEFGADNPNFRAIYQTNGHILPFTYNTRLRIPVPPCMSVKYVWVTVSNNLGFTPSVQFNRTLNFVSIVYRLLQYTGSDYSIVVRGMRTPNCNPYVHQHDNSYIPYGLKESSLDAGGGLYQKMRYSVNNNILQRKGLEREIFDAVDWKNSRADNDLKLKKYGYGNDLEDKYGSVKELYEDMSTESKEVDDGQEPKFMVFIITGNRATQATAENGGNVRYDRVSVKDDSDNHGLDYANGKDYSHKGSKYISLGEYGKGKSHDKNGGYDRGTVNAKGDTYRGYSNGNRYIKKEENSVGDGFKTNDKKSIISGTWYGGTNRHVKDKTSLGYGKGKGYEGKSNKENDQGHSDDSKIYRDTRNKNSIGNVKGTGHRGSIYDENHKGDSYVEDRYVASRGHGNNERYNGLDDDYLDFAIGNENQRDGREKEMGIFCSDYLRAYGEDLAMYKKVMDYCLFEGGRSKI